MTRIRSKEQRKKINKASTIRIRNTRVRKREMLIKYKGGSCQKCGYNKCNSALEFHHLDPSTKLFGFSASEIVKSDIKLKKEADKCIMLCANCHREEHYKLKNKYDKTNKSKL